MTRTAASQTILTTFIAACLMPPLSARAESGGHETTAHETHHHSHHVAIFAGNTHSDDHQPFTIGGEYEYMFSGLDYRLGIGALVDVTTSDPEHAIYAGTVNYHPMPLLKFTVAAGVEVPNSDDEDEGGDPHGETSESHVEENEFLMRFGVTIAVPVGERVTFGPTYNLDRVNGHTSHVFGFSLGIGF